MYAPFATCVHHSRARLSCRPPFHPHSRERLIALGAHWCSRYSRRCHLLDDLSLDQRSRAVQGKGAVTGTRRFRCGVFKPSSDLCCCQSALPCVVQRIVCLTRDPEMVQQDR
jgi:hypothetical protein